MRKCLFLILFLFMGAGTLLAQATFKAGWNTYATKMITREYTYTYAQGDSIKLYLTDSAITFTGADSLVTSTLRYAVHDKAVMKTVHYMNIKKQVLKTEEYKYDNLLELNEWKYDDKNRKILHIETNKVNGNVYKKSYEYSGDRKGEQIVTESAYFNGKIEFYTRSYYDRNMVKVKEVRLNDNNKDIIHTETYTYGANGKVKERSVYFPEFRVTRKFAEPEGMMVPKCYRTMPTGTADKANPWTKIAYIKRVLQKNMPVMNDIECKEYEYKFSNFSNCEITVATTKVNNNKRLTYSYREKI